MRREKAAMLAVSFYCLSCVAMAQGKFDHLRKWENEYPTYNKKHRNFFRLPEIDGPLRKLLSKTDFYLLTRGHKKEVPITVSGDNLYLSVCGANDCAGCCRNISLRINLNTGAMRATFMNADGDLKQYDTER